MRLRVKNSPEKGKAPGKAAASTERRGNTLHIFYRQKEGMSNGKADPAGFGEIPG